MANENNTNGNSRFWIIVTTIIAAVVVAAVFFSTRSKVIPVRADRVTRTTIISAISTNGKIEPIDSFEAHAPAPTTVQKIAVNEGDRVKPGQLLVMLDTSDARAQAAKAEAQLKAAQADLAAVEQGGTREEVLTNQAQLTKTHAEVAAAEQNFAAMKQLQEKGAASPEEVQAAKNKLASAQADLKLLTEKKTGRYSPSDIARAQSQADEARAALSAARDLLAKSEIRSTIDGTVYSLPVHQGEYLQAGDLVVAVAQLSTVRVRAFVDEPDIGRLQQGQNVEVTWDALPGRTWQGTLMRVPTTVVARGSRNVGEFTSNVNNTDHRLLPNVNVNVQVVTAKVENALTLPREAVHQDENGRFVYKVVGGKLRRTSIETGVSNLTQIQVTKGVSDGDVIALGTLSSQQLRDGLTVRVVQS